MDFLLQAWPLRLTLCKRFVRCPRFQTARSHCRTQRLERLDIKIYEANTQGLNLLLKVSLWGAEQIKGCDGTEGNSRSSCQAQGSRHKSCPDAAAPYLRTVVRLDARWPRARPEFCDALSAEAPGRSLIVLHTTLFTPLRMETQFGTVAPLVFVKSVGEATVQEQ